MGTGEKEAKAPPRYAECALAADPARCLLDRAVAQGVDGSEEILQEAIVGLGAPELAHLIDQEHPPYRASYVLAAALVRSPDPLADPLVRAAMAAAGDDALVIRNAVSTADMRIGGLVARAPGLPQVLAAAEAHARGDAWELISLADFALNRGYPEEGLALLRREAARPDATPGVRAHAARWLLWRGEVDEAHRVMPAGHDSRLEADIAVARLARGHDRDAVAAVLRQLEDELVQTSANHVVWAEPAVRRLKALAEVGEQAEVRCLGELYLERSRAPLAHEGPARCADWAALASDALRLAGDRDAAAAAAREGLQHVERQAAKWVRRLEGQGLSPAEARRDAQVYLTASPVGALYRAGCVEEALATGWLRPKERYWGAVDSGVERPDIAWLVDAEDRAGLGELRYQLTKANDRAGAGDLYEALLARRDADPERDTQLERELGELAAAAGRADAMRAHFAREAQAIDAFCAAEPDDAELAGRWALDLACAWRRSEVVLAGGD